MRTLRTRWPPRLPRAHDLGFFVLTIGVVNTPCLAQDVKPKPVTLQDLTVPRDRLPDGCSLKLVEPARREVISTMERGGQRVRYIGPTPSMQPAGITANPWMGTDRRILAWLRQRVDGYGELRLLDAPLTKREESALFLQFAEGLEEGYAATYAQSGAHDLGVHAVRFALTPEKRAVFPVDRPHTLVIETGSIRAIVYGDSGPCSTVIDTYLRPLGR